MARRRKARKTRAKTYVSKKARRYGKKADTMLGMPQTQILGATLYGMGRSKVSSELQKYGITQKIPAGNLADEVGMLGISYYVSKGSISKNPTIKAIGRAGVILESARIGEALITEGLQGFVGNTTTTTIPTVRIV